MKTLFLVNEQRLGDTYGRAAEGQVLDELPDVVKMTGVAGVVYPVESDSKVHAAYKDWDRDPCNPDPANAVSARIQTLVQGVRALHPELQNVVLVGSDDQLPMARLPDGTRISNEADYATTFGAANNEYVGALGRGYVLSDDPYGTRTPIPFLDRQLYVPDLAVGRLVETPAEIAGQLAQFEASNGMLDPKSALVTGYDFLSDGANAVADALETALAIPVDRDLIGNTWTRAQLIAKLFPRAARPRSRRSTRTSTIAAPCPPTRTRWASSGISSARTTSPRAASRGGSSSRWAATRGSTSRTSLSRASPPPDWPQTLAQQPAVFVANTGYGYGDTEAVAYSERLMALFARNLDRTLTVGQALPFAKQRYLGDLAVLSPYDEKALAEATFYGLPMYGIGHEPPPPPPAERETRIDPLTGLKVADFAVHIDGTGTNPKFKPFTTESGVYYKVRDRVPKVVDHDPQVTSYRPIEPRTELDVTVRGETAHGALLTVLASNDTPVDAVFDRPVVDLAGNEPEPTYADVAFPARLQALTRFVSPAAGPRQQLVLVPGQFLSVPGNPAGKGTQRLFTALEGLVYYSPLPDFTPPRFVRAGASSAAGGQVAFDVEVTDASTVKRVYVLFRDGGVWKGLDLTGDAGGSRWIGGAPVAGASVDYFVEAVDAAGNVAVANYKGALFGTEPGTPPPGDLLQLPDPTGDNGWYRAPVKVTLAQPRAATAAYSVDGAPFRLYTAPFTIDGDGVHTIRVHEPDQPPTTAHVSIDTKPPGVESAVPAEGALYALGSSPKASFTCSDATSGVATCTGEGPKIDTGSLGVHTFTVHTTDAAGIAGSRTISYRVVALTVAFPGGGPYRTATWNAGCAQPGICGDAQAGSRVEVAIQRVSTQRWWDGSGFAATRETFVAASGAGSWTYGFAAERFPAEGAYRVFVRQAATGNKTKIKSAATIKAKLTIDTNAPPTPTLTGHPANPSSTAHARFGNKDGEAGVDFLCSLDGASYVPCAKSQSYDSLAQGPHTYCVEAIDAAGNVSPARCFAWTILLKAT